MKWLRDAICHWMGWETYEEAYARILREMPPLEQQLEGMKGRDRMTEIAREVIRRRLDGDGEYERGIEGLQ